MKFFFLIILGLIILTCSSFSDEVKNLPYCPDQSIWKHAAYKGKSQSHIANIETVINLGYCGIELDIIYDENENMIYVSHNSIESYDEKKKYSLDHIDKVFKDSKVYVWLDWKNTNLFNLIKGSDIIKKSMKEYLSKEGSLILIETPNVIHNEILGMLVRNNKNIAVLNWLTFIQEKNNFIEKIKNIYRLSRAWFYVCVLPDRWVSSPNMGILSLCKNKKKAKSIFIFTINKIEKAKTIFLMGADVILSDHLLQN
ncbi:hypothetical protein N9E98_02770 [Candidatus Pelagibacter sp.]|nr:hypothetical protein [Candidatus Pelagibacter sp.]